MKIIKPLRLGIMNRPYYKGCDPYLGIAILALVDMQEKPLLRPEPELWKLAQDELTCSGGLIDLAYPKHYPEFLAVGHAYPHTCLAENVCCIGITLGEKQKSLIVSGDREWQGETPSVPQPFTSIPVDWSRSYGGPQIADNPLGIGANNGARHPLPNIESPSERLMSPSQQVSPAGLGPIDLTWPARQAFIGTLYDEEWVKRGMLGFADDADPRLFNMAPQDQQWHNLSALPSAMPYRIENMHPHHALLTGKLPSWQARCFVHHTTAGEEAFSEIEMRHTTVWFLPHLEKMLLVYHGECTIEEDDAHNIHVLMPALEHENQPRPLSHYRDVWIKRSDKEKGSIHAFQESDLLPEDAIAPWIDTELGSSESVHPLEQSLDARRQSIYQDVEQRLQTVDGKLPEGVKDAQKKEHPTLSQLPTFMAQLEEQARKAQDDAMQQVKQRIPDTQAYDARRPTGPESFYKMCEGLRQQQNGQLQPGQEESLYQLYRIGVQSQNAAPLLSGSHKTELREWVITKLAQDRDFSGCDLTGADLSHLDLSGANLTRTMMESADLSHTILDNATLTQTLLARSRMMQTSLRNTVLHEATLALANCSDCDFTGAILCKLVTEGAKFERCNFTRATLENQIFDQIVLSDCNFSAASLENVIFNAIRLDNPRFSAARLHKSTFIDSHLQKAVFEEAVLQRCSMVNSQADGIDFTRARLENCAFTAGTSLQGTCFTHAKLSACNLRQAPLNNADLSFAQLAGCDLSEALLPSANLFRIQASQSQFIRCDLAGADLRQANLMESRLQKARLIGCNFTAANLFRADISQAEISDTTIMQDSWTKQMKVYPLRKGAA
ncbi:DUF2169 domain-containing protein [Serratia sp. DD3]|uniref:DUF2169 family type VI secretion system accessory protein n=1 Tax=Serratia sp. DD3 TaxID=1410619 RepID=UPI0003C51F43|nr:DUF2169 domain-containing protein [Serratia sp. DD3]KEY58744.1 secreted effector protein pipB2 [Serratia sp. DD3]